MQIAVVVASAYYSRLNDLIDLLWSLDKQTYNDKLPIEVTIIIDGDKRYYSKLLRMELNKLFKNIDKITLVVIKKRRGLAYCRNIGIRLSESDVIAFIDDDSIAHPQWIEKLVDIYTKYGALGVGGPLIPIWYTFKPKYLPKDMLWLVGATPSPFVYRKNPTVSLKIFGSNMSFKREIFDLVGLFNTSYGLKDKYNLLGDETEFLSRISKLGLKNRIWYTPYAIVYHKIYPIRIKLPYLFRRAFYFGKTKAYIEKLHNISQSHEDIYYLQYVLKECMGDISRFTNGINRLLFRITILLLIAITYTCYSLSLLMKPPFLKIGKSEMLASTLSTINA